jgi:hypothetical protein
MNMNKVTDKEAMDFEGGVDQPVVSEAEKAVKNKRLELLITVAFFVAWILICAVINKDGFAIQ